MCTALQTALKAIETKKQSLLKANVKRLAKEQNRKEVEIIISMQVASVITNDNALLNRLCILKQEYVL